MDAAEHLWNIPAHREAWRAVAAQEGGYGQLYQRFCHFLDTDAVYLLNDAMQTLPKGGRGQSGHCSIGREDALAWRPCAAAFAQHCRQAVSKVLCSGPRGNGWG